MHRRSPSRAAGDAASRAAALKRLGVILTGHAIAEEAVVYPGLGEAGEKGHATMGYNEQVMVKMQMAMLEKLDPTSQDFDDKLEHIRGAVLHHMFEEEDHWFLRLKDDYPDQAFLTRRYQEEFKRYTGGAAQSQRANLLRESESRSWDMAETRPDPGMNS